MFSSTAAHQHTGRYFVLSDVDRNQKLITKITKNQSNVAEGGIAWQVYPTPRLHSAGGSTGLTVLPQFPFACFGWGFDPKSPLDIGPMSAPAEWHQNPSNGLSRVHECDRQTDRQTTLRGHL